MRGGAPGRGERLGFLYADPNAPPISRFFPRIWPTSVPWRRYVVSMVVACSMVSALAKSRCKLGKEDEGGKRC